MPEKVVKQIDLISKTKEEGIIHTVGKRKTAKARVFLLKGNFNIMVNGKKPEDYFPSDIYISKVYKPFKVCGIKTEEFPYEIRIIANGGGIKGQAEAIAHGISKALVAINPEYRAPLKQEGLLTRDPRMVERKKYGHHKARKGYQFRKR